MCCCGGARRAARGKKTPNYRDPAGGAAPVFQPWAGAYRGVHDPQSAPAEGGAVPLEDIEHQRLSNPFTDSYRPESTYSQNYAPPPGPPPHTEFGHSRDPSGASYNDPFTDPNVPFRPDQPPRYQ